MKRSILCGLAAAVALGACSSGQGEALSTEGTFTVAITPAELTLEARGTAVVTVTIASLDGFADVVEVSPAGLPAGISADPLVISPSQSSGQLVLRSGGTEAASRVPVTVTATSSSHTSTAAFALTLVGSFGLRLPGWRRLAASGRGALRMTQRPNRVRPRAICTGSRLACLAGDTHCSQSSRAPLRLHSARELSPPAAGPRPASQLPDFQHDLAVRFSLLVQVHRLPRLIER